MASVVEDAAAEDFGVDTGAAFASMIESLEHEHGGAFAHHEAGAIRIEWPARLHRVRMVGQHAHVVKTGGKQWVNGLGAAGECEVALPVMNGAHGLENRNRATGPGRRGA